MSSNEGGLSMLLEKILNHPKVKEYMKEEKELNPELTELDAQIDALRWFFTESYDLIFSIDDIYKYVVEVVKSEVEHITDNKKRFINSLGEGFDLKEFVDEMLEELLDDLEYLLKGDVDA
jgi:prefoldin subunit 5